MSSLRSAVCLVTRPRSWADAGWTASTRALATVRSCSASQPRPCDGVPKKRTGTAAELLTPSMAWKILVSVDRPTSFSTCNSTSVARIRGPWTRSSIAELHRFGRWRMTCEDAWMMRTTAWPMAGITTRALSGVESRIASSSRTAPSRSVQSEASFPAASDCRLGASPCRTPGEASVVAAWPASGDACWSYVGGCPLSRRFFAFGSAESVEAASETQQRIHRRPSLPTFSVSADSALDVESPFMGRRNAYTTEAVAGRETRSDKVCERSGWSVASQRRRGGYL